MKIQKINLTWFRGASEDVRLDTNGKSVVIYGDNASGKSSFADAFEFIIRNGKIEHLAHEYAKSVGDLKKCVRNTKTPSDADSIATIEFDTKEKASAIIPPTGTIRFESEPPEFISTIQSWEIAHHLLRQNEIAEFINKSKTQKYSVLSPLLGLAPFEQIADNILIIQSQLEKESRLDYLRGSAQVLREDLEKHFGDLTDISVERVLRELAKKYKIESTPNLVELAKKGIEKISLRERDIAPEIQRKSIAARILDVKIIDDLNIFIEIYKESEDIKDELLEHKINILEESSKYVEIPEENVIECPACGNQISLEEFKKHIIDELESLKKYREYKRSIENYKMRISKKTDQITNFIDENFLKWIEESLKASLKNIFEENKVSLLQNPSEKWVSSDVIRAKSCLEDFFKMIKEEAKKEIPEISEMYEGKSIFESSLKIPEYLNIVFDIEKIIALSKDLDNIYKAIREKISEKTRTTLEVISEDVREIWDKLHPAEPIESISLIQSAKNETAIDISLKFFGTEQLSPRLTLSESYRNSLGLSIFLAFANQGSYKMHPIILDDIVSSLDSNHMGMVAELLNEGLADRQIIILTHDRTWYRRLYHQLDHTKWDFYELLPWVNPEVGIRPNLISHTFKEAEDLLQSNPRAAGNAVRTLMDVNIPLYAWHLRLELPFIPGPKNEERTNHEFFEKLITEGKRQFKIKDATGAWTEYTAATECWEKADKLLEAWANPASHGGLIAPTEVKKLIETCESALNYFKCPQCGTNVWRIEDKDRKLCKCRVIRWG